MPTETQEEHSNQQMSATTHTSDLNLPWTKVPLSRTRYIPIWIQTSAPLASMTTSIPPSPRSGMPRSPRSFSVARLE